MKRIIPIIALCVAGVGIAIAIASIIVMSIAVNVPAIAIVSIPVAIIGVALSGLSISFTAMFFKNVLCRIALFINIGSLVISFTSILIWICAL